MNEHIIKLADRIKDVAEEVVSLYEPVERLLLPNCDQQLVKKCMQLWMMDAGRSPESAVCKQTFQCMTTILNGQQEPYLVRLLFLFDVQSLLDAIVDRISSLESKLYEFYRTMPHVQTHRDEEYTRSMMSSGPEDDVLLVTANSMYVAMASAFDLLTKVAVELDDIPKKEFKTYSKSLLIAVNCTYSSGKNIDARLKAEGTLLSEPEIPRVKEVVQLRSEYVHNGPWDRRTTVYEAYIGDEPVDVFVLMPDVEANGSLVSMVGRRTFYSQGRKLNVELYRTVEEVLNIISNTLTAFRRYIEEEVKKQKGSDVTEQVIAAIMKLNNEIEESHLVDNTNSILLCGTPMIMIESAFEDDLQRIENVKRLCNERWQK